MTANKMPEMPEADLKAGADWPKDYFESQNVHRLHAEWQAFSAAAEKRGYLAGIEAARSAVAADTIPPMKCWSVGYAAGRIDSRRETLTNLTALEQGAKK